MIGSLAGYVDQDPDALVLTVTKERLDALPFRYFAHGSRAFRSLTVHARVIGGSHVISYGQSLHELFACEQLPGVPSTPLAELERTPTHRLVDGLWYEFCAQRVAWTGQDEPSELVALRKEAQDNELTVAHDFPRSANDPVAPTTIITMGMRGQSLVVKTAHSYPRKGVVLSQSVLENF